MGNVYREAPLPARRPVDTRVHEDRIEIFRLRSFKFHGDRIIDHRTMKDNEWWLLRRVWPGTLERREGFSFFFFFKE